MLIPFNFPFVGIDEQTLITDSLTSNHLHGDGPFTHKCHKLLEKFCQCGKALLTPSCTAALELAALLIDVQPGDEIIMPSYTFVSTANAFVLRGGVPIFIDLDPNTLNMNVDLIEKSISSKTKAIVPVHYAGVPCDLTSIKNLAAKYNLYVIEDAAQAIMSSYNMQPIGSHSDLVCLSFHATKNVICGEGGAILINNSSFYNKAEIYREKGTNRANFIRGDIDKYTWVDHGSSFLPSDLSAAFLFAQLQSAELITQKRLSIWDQYYNFLLQYQAKGLLKLPTIPSFAQHNGHIFYFLFNNPFLRNIFIKDMHSLDVQVTFHYIPLHETEYYQSNFGISASLPITEKASKSIVRLPIYPSLDIDKVLSPLKITLDNYLS